VDNKAEKVDGAKVGQEKKFDECTIEEKIERLRRVQQSTVRMQADLIDNLRRRLNALESHQHGTDGRLLIGLHDARHAGGLEGAGYMRDPLA
jgi:hypothetical protein